MVELFEGETLEKYLNPCKLAWTGYYLKALSYFLLTLIILLFSESKYIIPLMEWIGFDDKCVMTLAIWAIAIILLNLSYSFNHVSFGYLLSATVIIAGFALIIYGFDATDNWQSLLLAYSFIISVLLLWLADISRASHVYLLTNKRIILKGKIIRKDERELGYESITDLNFKQGVFGRMFNYGTLTPVSQSGIGIETKIALAGGGMAKTLKSWGFFGIFGGGKTTQDMGGKTYYILFGVKPFKDVKGFVERQRYERSTATQQERQIELTEKMADNLDAVRQKIAPRVLFCPIRETEVEETMCENCPYVGTCEYYKNLNKG